MSFSLGTQTRGGHRQGDRDLSVPLSVELDDTTRTNQCDSTLPLYLFLSSPQILFYAYNSITQAGQINPKLLIH